MRELKDVNSRLFKLVSDKDFEIRRLKKKVEEDQIALAGMAHLLHLILRWYAGFAGRPPSSSHMFRGGGVCGGRGGHQDRGAVQEEQGAEC